MARIPDASSLRRQVVPQARSRIQSDRSGEIIGGAIAQVGDQFARAYAREEQEHNRFNYTRAHSQLLQAEIVASKQLEGDQDWATFEPRYRERMKVDVEKASKLISDPRDRALFDEETKLAIERGSLQVNEISRRTETDWGRAQLEETLSKNREAALTAKDPATRTSLVKTTNTMIDSASKPSASGAVYLSAEDAGTLRRKWNEDYGEGYIATLPPEQRIKVLSNPKGTPAEFIQSDRQVLLLRAAQNEDKEVRVRGEAQHQEDSIFAAGGSLESMRKKARAIEDPMVRDSTLLRLEGRFADREGDRTRHDTALRRQAWDVVLDGGKWEDIPTSVVSDMDPQDGIQIKNYLAQRAAGGVKSDPESWYKLNQMAGEDPKAFAEVDLLKFRDQLGEEDFESFAEKQESIKGDVRAGDSIQTDNQLVNTALGQMGIRTSGEVRDVDRERTASFHMAFQRELTAVLKESGQKATVQQKQAIVDKLAMEVVTERGWFTDSTARLFEADQVLEVIVPDAERKEIVAALRRKGIEPSEERIQSLYVRGKQ